MTLVSGETDVLVVGAGPVGLALACGLARGGTTVRIVEQRSEKADSARATTIAPRTLEVLDDLGVVDAALDGVWTDLPVRQYKDGVLMFDASVAAAATPRTAQVPYPVAARPLPTWRMEQVLTDQLAQLGVKVETDRRLVHLDQLDDHVTARLASTDGATTSIQARYVVGCDGAHSSVRDLAGIGFDNMRDHDFSVYIAELSIDGIEPTYARMWLADDGFVFASPIPLTHNWQLQAQIPIADMTDPPPFTVDVAQRLLTTRSAQPAVTCRDMTWSSTYTIRERLAATYRKGRVLVAGDAAHVHSPMGGQGANTGIQDAYNLAWKLNHVLAEVSPVELLDTYEGERRPVAAKVLADTGRDTRTNFSPGIVGRVMRWAVFRLFGRRMLAKISQLDLAYPDSLLTVKSAGRHSPRAGERAPDGRLVRASDGRRMRVFDATRGPQFTLLLFGAGTADVAIGVAHAVPSRLAVAVIKDVDDRVTVPDGVQVYVDPQFATTRAFSAQDGRIVLVRPDGYIAFAGDRSDVAKLHAYLRRWLTVEPKATR